MRYKYCKNLALTTYFSCKFYHMKPRKSAQKNRQKDLFRVERAKQGVFHYLSKKHLCRYLHEIGFRWNQREPELKVSRKGSLKIVMKRLQAITMLKLLLVHAPGRQVRRSANGGILCLEHV
jgi:hypothetical protein